MYETLKKFMLCFWCWQFQCLIQFQRFTRGGGSVLRFNCYSCFDRELVWRVVDCQKSAKMFATHWLPEAKVEFLSDFWTDGIDILATKVGKHQVLKLNTGVHQGCWCLYQAVYWAWVLSWVRAKQNLSPWTPQLVLILLVLCHTIPKLQELKINGTIGEREGTLTIHITRY